MNSPLLVTAAILERRGKLFLARRALGKHMAGHWEFPGGKIDDGEPPEVCLEREMREEFGIQVRITNHFMTTTHHYADRSVTLLALRVRHLRGRFMPTSHDRIGWFTRPEMRALLLAPADVPIAHALGMPRSI